ncbi:MAG: DUF72 domain-containing protein [Planctomycetaceae bacterium]
MRLFVGTSGFSYLPWRGSFYPQKLRKDEMLGYYAQRFRAVEINSTNYRMPRPDDLKVWNQQVPAGFRFILKAPQRITQFKRLKGVEQETAAFLKAAAALGSHSGPLLFLLPQMVKKDLASLASFLPLLEKGTRAAFEFRHASWFDSDVTDCLRAHSCALCFTDGEESPQSDLVDTADWGYLRMRRDDYDAAALRRWIKRLAAREWKEAYVFFKHEDTGRGPKLATRFLELADA